MSAPGRKVCLITGSSGGIGKATAVALAQKGFDIIMACRPSQKAETAFKDVQAASPDATVTLLDLDVSSPPSIRLFVKKFESLAKPLHVLVNNAGVMMKTHSTTEAGLEKSIATNLVGPYLLTELILDHLAAAGTKEDPARIINVGSVLEKRGNIRYVLDVLAGKPSNESYDMFSAYGSSKQGLLMWTYQLQHRLAAENKHIVANAMHPGVCGTELGRDQPVIIRGLMWPLNRFVFRTAEDGAAGVVYLAALDSTKAVELGGGNYMGKMNTPELSSPASRDGEKGKELVEALAAYCKGA